MLNLHAGDGFVLYGDCPTLCGARLWAVGAVENYGCVVVRPGDRGVGVEVQN